MFRVLESEIITLMLCQNYDSDMSRQLLNSFKTLTIIYIFWSSAPLKETGIIPEYTFCRKNKTKSYPFMCKAKSDWMLVKWSLGLNMKHGVSLQQGTWES